MTQALRDNPGTDGSDPPSAERREELLMSETKARLKVGTDLTEGSIMKTLIVFAIPMILANLVQQLYNTVDLIVIGKFAGSAGTVGTGTGGELANFLTLIGMGFSGAGQVYIAQLAGAKQQEKVRRAIGTLLTLMISASVVLGVAGSLVTRPFLNLINTPAEAFEPAREYMIVTCLGMPFVFGYNAVCGILRGMGESKRPLEFVIVAAVVNVVLDILFVAVFKLGCFGTALATVLAQAASFFMALRFMYRSRVEMGFEFKAQNFKPYAEQTKVILRLGLLKAAQGALINVSMLYCSAQVNSFGLVAAAVNNIGNKITRFSNIVTTSVDTGAAAIIGQSLGAGKPERAKKTVYSALIIAMAITVVNCVLALTIPRGIFRVFSDDPAVIEFGVTYMHISLITFVLAGFMGPYGAMITGDGNAVYGFIIGILDSVVLRIGISIVLAQVFDMGVLGYFYGIALGRVAPTIMSVAYFYSNRWRKRKLLSEG